MVSRFLRLWGNLPCSWIQWGAQWGGSLWYALDRRHRKIAESNICLALGYSCEQSRVLAKANFIHLARVVLETAKLTQIHRGNYRDFVEEVRGTEYLEESLKLGKGIVFLTGHFGNWEWLAYCAAFLLPSRLNVVVRPLEPAWLNRVVYQHREKSGNRVIARKDATKLILRALARNEMVGVLFDHNAKRRMAIDAPFFGGYVPTNRGIALLAIKSGAPVHPAFAWREPSGKFRMEAHPPVPIPSEGSMDERVWNATALFNRCLEEQIRRDPAQWFWVYRRFKRYRKNL
jgi:KDO2-lipid IV(A) lauroyltransferase